MNKYKNRNKNGFDSVKEYNRFFVLSIMQKAGIIQGLERQVRFELLPSQYEDGKCIFRGCSYIADFTYWQNGKFVVEDVKGYKKGEAYKYYTLKKKMLYYFHHIKIKEI